MITYFESSSGTSNSQHTAIVGKSLTQRSQSSVCYTHLLHNWFDNLPYSPQSSADNGSKNFHTKHLHTLPKGLCTKGRRFHFRKRVPKDIQIQIGKKEIWRSLKTDSLQSAKRRLPIVIAQVTSEIEYVRQQFGLSVDETLLEPLKDDIKKRSIQDLEECALTFSDAYERYLNDPTHSWSLRTRSSYTTSRNLSVAIFGANLPISRLSRAHCRTYIEILRFLPCNAAKRFPKLTPIEAAAMTKADPKISTISAANANVYLADLSTFLNWAVNEELLSHNPVRGLRLPDRVPKRDKRLPFSKDQLRKIFHAPLYTGCLNGQRGYASKGNQKPRNARFWVPLIALHSGLRLNEICQLDVTDVQEITGISCISISEKSIVGSRDKNLKTSSSERIIPIHKNLLSIGLPEFVARRRSVGHTKLFHEVTAGSKGIRSIAFSKWFTQFVRKCKADSPRTCFHSFRHNFRDELRAAQIEHDIGMALGGWANDRSASAGVAEIYGKGYRIEILKSAIDRLEFLEIDLSHLFNDVA